MSLKKENRLIRLFKELRLFRKEQSVFEKAKTRTLKKIEDKEQQGASGHQSFLGALLGRLVTTLSIGIPTALTVVLGPVGLAIGGAATVAWGLFTESGKKFFADAGKMINQVWSPAAEGFKGKLVKGFGYFYDVLSPIGEYFKETFGSVRDKLAEPASKLNNFVMDKTGFDVKESVKTGYGKVVDFTSRNIIEPGANVVKGSIEKGNYGLDVVTDLSSKAKAKLTGKSSDNKNILIQQMMKSGITDPKEQALFLAQVDVESGGFSRLEENLNYRSASRLMEVSKTARSKGADAINQAIATGPEGVAELLYGGRKDLGNVEAGDGYKFRGRGFIQLTGRANYAKAGQALGIDLENNPELAADPEVASKIAVWFHKKDKRLVEASRAGDVKTARKLVNGGLNGLKDVKTKYADYLAETATGKFAAPEVKTLSPIQVATVNSESMPIPKAIPMPKLSALAEAPQVIEPPMVDDFRLIIDESDYEDEPLERGLAHAVTTGMPKQKRNFDDGLGRSHIGI